LLPGLALNPKAISSATSQKNEPSHENFISTKLQLKLMFLFYLKRFKVHFVSSNPISFNNPKATCSVWSHRK
jgi:hypothetical protein